MDSAGLEQLCAEFWHHGFAVLRGMLPAAIAQSYRDCVIDLMLGHCDPNQFFFQHDSATGEYSDLEYGKGFVGPSLHYRKVEHLERHEVLRQWIESPVLEPVVKRLHGDSATLLYRAAAWNKAAGGGTELPWHQDGGAFWGLSKPPVVQAWTALDDADESSGCMWVIPQSHRSGLATPDGGVVPPALVKTRTGQAIPLGAKRGDVIIFHNMLWHRSGRNSSANSRIALSVSYLGSDTRCTRKKGKPRQFVRLFDDRRPSD